MAISREQILAAADQIAGAGGTPTLAAVRDAVGGGSFTTISEVLKAWRATHQPTAAPAADLAPAALVERLTAVAADAWTFAVRLAADELAADRASVAADRSALEQEHAALAAQLVQERAVLAAQLADARERAERAELHGRTLAAELLSAQTAAAAGRVSLDAAAREIAAAQDDARTARAAATEAGEALASLRGQMGVKAPAKKKPVPTRQGGLLP